MTEIKYAIQDEYADEFSWCYGCGRLNESGLHVRTGWQADQTIAYYEPREDQIGIPGVVYGGLISSIVDCHGTSSASLALHRKNGNEPGDGVEPPRFVTASLHVDFIKPTPHGVTLKIVGKVEEIHPKRFVVKSKVYAYDEVCATGEVVAVVMPDSFME